MAKPAVALMISKGAPKPFDAPPKEDAAPTFKAPEGFEMEGKKPGDTVEFVCEATVGEDGMLTIKSLNGIPLSGGDEDDKNQPFDDEEGADKSGGFVSNAMPGSDEGEAA